MLKGLVVQRGEGSWLEVVGGRGAFGFIRSLGGYFSYLTRLSLKGIGMILVRSLIVFY